MNRRAPELRSSPRGAPRDARVAGTPLRGPRAADRGVWIPGRSAFTRVCDALCAGMSGIGRREFILALGGAAASYVSWPLAAREQQPARVPRIGIVDDAPMWHSFRQALREFGYVEGQSVNYEYRYTDGLPDPPPPPPAQPLRPPPHFTPLSR